MVHTQGQNLSNHDRKQYLDIHETNKRPATGAAKSLQSCLTLCNPIDGSPPGSAVPGIHQARTPEWGQLQNLFHFFKENIYLFIWLCLVS